LKGGQGAEGRQRRREEGGRRRQLGFELRGIGKARKSERMRDWGKGVEEARVRAGLGEGAEGERRRCGASGGIRVERQRAGGEVAAEIQRGRAAAGRWLWRTVAALADGGCWRWGGRRRRHACEVRRIG
jgi:hypothetical protein